MSSDVIQTDELAGAVAIDVRDLQELIGPSMSLAISSGDLRNGGLLAVHRGFLQRIDHIPSMGLAFNGRTLARALMGEQGYSIINPQAEIVWYDQRGLRRLERLDGVSAVHDLLVDPLDDEALLIVSTATNAVVRYSHVRGTREVLRPSAVGDASHRNCLVRHGLRTYVTAFTDGYRRRDWDNRRETHTGVLVDIASGEVVLENLSRPHSPIRTVGNDGWIIANSGVGEILWCWDNGDRNALQLGHWWPQDIIRCGEHLFVGMSFVRRTSRDDFSEPAGSARIAVIREATRTVEGVIEVPSPTVYDMSILPVEFMDGARIGVAANQIRFFSRALSSDADEKMEKLDDPLPQIEWKNFGVSVENSIVTCNPADDVVVTGSLTFRGSNRQPTVGDKPLRLGWRWPDGAGDGRYDIAGVLVPGQSIPFEVVVPAPSEPGTHVLEVQVVQEFVAWIGEVARIEVEVIGPRAGLIARGSGEPVGDVAGDVAVVLAATRGRSKRERVDSVGSWWHSVDLGDGVVTPGHKQPQLLLSEWNSLELPSLAGRSVLDIGAWDGWFSFKSEQEGAARVVAVDDFVWTVRWDVMNSEIARLTRSNLSTTRLREMDHLWDRDGLPGKKGFDLCREVLGSEVEPLVANYMDLDPADVGTFDVVLYLGVLYHEPNPVASLDKVRALTKSLAVIETSAVFVPGFEDRPMADFYPNDQLGGDNTNWWGPNAAAVCAMAKAVGFSDARITKGPPAEWSSLPPGSDAQIYRLVVQARV